MTALVDEAPRASHVWIARDAVVRQVRREVGARAAPPADGYARASCRSATVNRPFARRFLRLLSSAHVVLPLVARAVLHANYERFEAYALDDKDEVHYTDPPAYLPANKPGRMLVLKSSVLFDDGARRDGDRVAPRGVPRRAARAARRLHAPRACAARS